VKNAVFIASRVHSRLKVKKERPAAAADQRNKHFITDTFDVVRYAE
jgi:hypothetical protein